MIVALEQIPESTKHFLEFKFFNSNFKKKTFYWKLICHVLNFAATVKISAVHIFDKTK